MPRISILMLVLAIGFFTQEASAQDKTTDKTKAFVAQLAGTKWVNSNKATFEWDLSGKLFHNGKPRDFQAVDDHTIKIVFGDKHIDTFVFNPGLTSFEQFSTSVPKARPLFQGTKIADSAEKEKREALAKEAEKKKLADAELKRREAEEQKAAKENDKPNTSQDLSVGELLKIDGGDLRVAKQIKATKKNPLESVHFDLPVPTEGDYRLTIILTKGANYGVVQFVINGKGLGVPPFDGFSNEVIHANKYELGTVFLRKGNNTLEGKTLGKNVKASGAIWHVDHLTLQRVITAKEQDQIAAKKRAADQAAEREKKEALAKAEREQQAAAAKVAAEKAEKERQLAEWNKLPSLPGVDGKNHLLSEYKKDVVVVCFLRNSCPVSLAHTDGLIAFNKKHGEKVDFVAIYVSNHDRDEDKLPKIKERGFTFPCLFDESKVTARSLGAKVTPHFFVFNKDRTLIYQGAMADNIFKPTVRYLEEATEAGLKGETPKGTAESRAKGSPIYYPKKKAMVELPNDAPVVKADKEAQEGFEALATGTTDTQSELQVAQKEPAKKEETSKAKEILWDQLTQRLNKLANWTVASGEWKEEKDGILGKGNSILHFKERLPSDFQMEFDMTVIAGRRPRVHFHWGSKSLLYLGTEGDRLTLFPYGGGIAQVQGTPSKYRPTEVQHIKAIMEGEKADFWVNGKSIASGKRSLQPVDLALSAGDGFSGGTVRFSNFKLSAAPKREDIVAQKPKEEPGKKEEKPVVAKESSKSANPTTIDTGIASDQMTMSQDGTILAIANWSLETVIIWDIQNRKTKWVLGTGKFVSGLSISPDGKLVALSYLEGNGMALWDLETGKKRATFGQIDKGWGSSSAAPAFSPDSKTVALKHDHQVDLWNIAERRVISRLKGHSKDICSIAFSPDGKMLASSGIDRIIMLWDVASGTSIGKMNSELVTCLAFNLDATILASGGWDWSTKKTNVSLWDVKNKKKIADLKQYGQPNKSLVFSPDGQLLASADDNSIILWDIPLRRQLATIPGHTEHIIFVGFCQSNQTLVSVSRKGTICRWDISKTSLPLIAKLFDPAEERAKQREKVSLEKIVVLEGHKEAVTAVLFCPNKNLMVTGSGGNVMLWEVPIFKKVAQLDIGGVNSLSISPNGKYLAVGLGSGPAVDIWDVENRKKLKSLKWKDWGQGGEANVAFAPGGKLLAVGISQPPGENFMWQGSVHLVETTNWNVEHNFGKTFALPGLGFSADGKTLLADGSDAIIEIDMTTRKPRKVDPYIGFIHGIASVAFSPDGKYKANGRSFLGRASDGPEVRKGTLMMNGVAPTRASIWRDIDKNNDRIAVAFSSDSKLFAAGIAGSEKAKGEIVLWRTSDTEEVLALQFSNPVNSIAFAPDTEFFAAGVGSNVIVYRIARKQGEK